MREVRRLTPASSAKSFAEVGVDAIELIGSRYANLNFRGRAQF